MAWVPCPVAGLEGGAAPARFGHVAVAVDARGSWGAELVVVFGGVHLPAQSGPEPPQSALPAGHAVERRPEALNDVVVLQTAQDGAWFMPTVTGGPPPPRAFHAAAAAGQTVYVTGGHVLAQEGAGAATKVFHDDLWALDVASWQWRQLQCTSSSGQGPCKRDMAMLCTVDASSLILFGGRNEAGRAMNDAWMLDTSRCLWTPIRTAGPCPAPRKMHAAVVAKGWLIVLGGERDTGAALDELWTLRLPELPPGGAWHELLGRGGEELRWTAIRVRPMPPARFGHAMVLQGGRLAVFGGCLDARAMLGLTRTYVQSSELWQLDLASFSWSKVEPPPASVPSAHADPQHGPGPSERMCHSLTALSDGRLLLLGGRSGRARDGICGDPWWLTLPPAPTAASPAAAAAAAAAGVAPALEQDAPPSLLQSLFKWPAPSPSPSATPASHTAAALGHTPTPPPQPQPSATPSAAQPAAQPTPGTGGFLGKLLSAAVAWQQPQPQAPQAQHQHASGTAGHEHQLAHTQATDRQAGSPSTSCPELQALRAKLGLPGVQQPPVARRSHAGDSALAAHFDALKALGAQQLAAQAQAVAAGHARPSLQGGEPGTGAGPGVALAAGSGHSQGQGASEEALAGQRCSARDSHEAGDMGLVAAARLHLLGLAQQGAGELGGTQAEACGGHVPLGLLRLICEDYAHLARARAREAVSGRGAAEAISRQLEEDGRGAAQALLAALTEGVPTLMFAHLAHEAHAEGGGCRLAQELRVMDVPVVLREYAQLVQAGARA